METVTVDAKALEEVLGALSGPDYLIRELQAIRVLGNSPIDKLIAQFNEQAEKNAAGRAALKEEEGRG